MNLARTLHGDRRGSASIELALCALVLAVALMNAVDVGYYIYNRMEVENAAQMGAQAAWKTCNQTSLLPATVNCPGLNSAVTTSIHSTTLGTSVSLPLGSPSEHYYCINTSSALQVVGTLNSPPTNCSSVGNASLQPGDYLLVQVSYSYAPLFPGVTVMSAQTVSKTAWMRMK